MDVSVIVPTYNSKNRLGECLGAILKQDFKNFEVIVVNDGSTDGTEQLAKTFNVKVFSKINQGPAIARNFGAQKSAGKILVFIDDDCIAEKNWLKEMIKPFQDPKVVGVQGTYKSQQKELCAIFEQIEIEDRYDKIQKAKNLDWTGSYSAAFRRSVFFETQGYDESFPTASGEDTELSFKLVKAGHKLAFNKHAIVYHKHETKWLNYFRKKFFRAYWRVLLYRKHTDKILNDSYTPQTLKLQIVLFYLSLIAPIFIILFFNASLQIILASELFILFLGLVSAAPFTFKAMRKNFVIGIISPIILAGRSVVFGLGLIAGGIKGVWLR